MAEIVGTWRDAWKRLGHNPLLLLLIVLGIGALAEGAARFIDAMQSWLGMSALGTILSQIVLSGATFALALAVCWLGSVCALLVVAREGSFFSSRIVIAVARFSWRVVLVWLVLLFVPNLLGTLIGVLMAMGPFDVHWGVLAVFYAVVQALLASLLLRRLPEVALRDQHLWAVGASAGSWRRSLLPSYLLLFCGLALIEIAVWNSTADGLSPIAAYRIKAMWISVESFWATLLSFAAYQRSAARNPAAAAVFD